jgi:tetratricopeptide (TPR) repeat protein
VNIGAIRQQAGDLRSAKEAYEQALAAGPETAEGLYNLATICESHGARDEAERLYARVAAHRGDSAEDASFRVGYLRLQKGDLRGAVEAFSACLRRRPQWTAAGVNLAIAHWRAGDKDAAVRAFEDVLTTDAGAVEAIRGLAALAIEREDFERALDLQARLITLGENNPELLYNTGLLLHRTGQFDDAIQLYTQALEQRADFAEAYLNLGHAWKAKGNIETARECWNKALSMKPELARDYFPS